LNPPLWWFSDEKYINVSLGAKVVSLVTFGGDGVTDELQFAAIVARQAICYTT